MTFMPGRAQLDLACPYCPSHPSVFFDPSSNSQKCPSCNRTYPPWEGKPNFIGEQISPLTDTWKRSYLKTKNGNSLFGIPRRLIIRLFKILSAPRANLGRGRPHFDLLATLAARGPFKALFIGYNQPFPETTRKNIIQLNIIPEQHVDVVAMGEYLPFSDETFELVVISGVIEHTQQPFKVVEEAHRVLKPMGRIYVSSPWVYPLHGSDNYRFSHAGLKLLCHQFRDFQIGSLNGPLHALAMFLTIFISDALSFGNRYLCHILKLIGSWLIYPLMLLDAISNRRTKSNYSLDADIFIVATKGPNRTNLPSSQKD
jgi:SAM-dependent methyltransferase